MRRILGTGGVVAAMVVALWRLLASVSGEHRRLAASGELGERLAHRRQGRIDRAIARERERAPIRVPVTVLAQHHASVQVGAARAPEPDDASDVDDLELLDASMRRRRSVPLVVRRADPAPAESAPAEIETTALVAGEEQSRSDDFAWLESGVVDSTRTGAGVLAPVLLVVGLLGSFVPLVRPLGDASPWIALGSALLVALGWWRARS